MATIKNNKTFQVFTCIDGKRYSVTMPLNTWDTNFHFIDDDNNDYLVDLQDVIDYKNSGNGAGLKDAIAYANELNDEGIDFWWFTR